MKNFLLALFIFLTVVSTTFIVIQCVEGKITTRNLEDKDDLIARYQQELSEKPAVVTEYINVPQYVEKIVTKITTIEKIVTQNVTVEVEVPIVLSDWNSIEELKTFLANDTSDSHVYLTVDNGVASFNGICEHRAFKLRDNALEIGKRLDTEILTKEECFKYQECLGFSTQTLNELPDNNGHYIVKAIVGNEIWFIEPSNDNVWLCYYVNFPDLTVGELSLEV
jgi:hypothetical protein